MDKRRLNDKKNYTRLSKLQLSMRFWEVEMFSFRRAKAAHLRLGQKGEAIAKAALMERKMDFLCQNYKCTYGEIDLLFRENGILRIVEVKTRHRFHDYMPADAVTHKKRVNIIKSAECYLKEIGNTELPVRFDIVEVIFDGKLPAEVNLIPEAFDKGELTRGKLLD